jgi:hypothetical protein
MGFAMFERHFRAHAASNIARGGRVQCSKVARSVFEGCTKIAKIAGSARVQSSLTRATVGRRGGPNPLQLRNTANKRGTTCKFASTLIWKDVHFPEDNAPALSDLDRRKHEVCPLCPPCPDVRSMNCRVRARLMLRTKLLRCRRTDARKIVT